MLEEIGIPYEHVPIRPYTESRSAEHLRINPNGRIPSLEDDGFVLWESLASQSAISTLPRLFASRERLAFLESLRLTLGLSQMSHAGWIAVVHGLQIAA
jgi:hypothetical protein